MWWPSQTPETQDMFKAIVARKQLEFVGAGWSQCDEVSPSYRDIVDNTATGHEYLRRTLGDACPNGRCVRFGWQIDMFSGYSATTPSLWANAGYDGMVIRFEGPDDMRNQWTDEQAFEFLWEDAVLGTNKSRILTHIIRWNYGDMLGTSKQGLVRPTKSFAFSEWVLKTQADVEAWAAALVSWSRARGSVFQAGHLAVWGSDFQFANASSWFRQMDMIVKEITNNPKKYNANIRYTTLSEYFDHLHSLELEFPVKRGVDFEFGWPHAWGRSPPTPSMPCVLMLTY